MFVIYFRTFRTNFCFNVLGYQAKNPEDVSDDDDEEYYRQEVGQAPDKDLFDKSGSKRKMNGKDVRFKKKRKIDSNHKKSDFNKNSRKPGGGASKAKFKVTMNKKVPTNRFTKKKLHTSKPSKKRSK